MFCLSAPKYKISIIDSHKLEPHALFILETESHRALLIALLFLCKNPITSTMKVGKCLKTHYRRDLVPLVPRHSRNARCSQHHRYRLCLRLLQRLFVFTP